MSEGDMTICSPSTGYIALGLRPRAILPASGEQIVMSPSSGQQLYNKIYIGLAVVKFMEVYNLFLCYGEYNMPCMKKSFLTE